MKRNLGLLASIVLIICLISLAFDQIVSSSTVHAASETRMVYNSSGSFEEEADTSSRSPQPVDFVAAGVVFVLFGVIAVFPLLVGDPAKVSQEINQAEK